MAADGQGLRIKCPACGKSLKVPDSAAGKKVKCGGCQSPIRIPENPVASSPAPSPKRTEPDDSLDPFLAASEPSLRIAGSSPQAPPKPASSQSPKPVSVAARKPTANVADQPRVKPPQPVVPDSHVDEFPVDPPAGRLSSKAEQVKKLLESFSGEFPRPRVTLTHRLVGALVLCFMLTLPLVYLAMAGGVAWLTWWHATHSWVMLQHVRGRAALFGVLLYGGLIVIGAMWVFSMIRPIFRFGRWEKLKGLNRRDDALLYLFADRVADVVGSPRPTIIMLSPEVNASAGYRASWGGLGGRDFILTLGMPLIAGLTLEQLAGVIAHEFGHFSQRGSSFLQRGVHRINTWFAQVVYSRDMVDATIESMTESGAFGLVIIGFVCWLAVSTGRGVMWCLMMLSHSVSCTLMRQMEYDAD